jgi:hypothetical protein
MKFFFFLWRKQKAEMPVILIKINLLNLGVFSAVCSNTKQQVTALCFAEIQISEKVSKECLIPVISWLSAF